MKLSTFPARLITLCVASAAIVGASVLASAPASAETTYQPPCGKVSLTAWTAKNISCSKQIRHLNYVSGDGWKYDAYVSKGKTSSAPICWANCDETAFQEYGSNGSTGYRF